MGTLPPNHGKELTVASKTEPVGSVSVSFRFAQVHPFSFDRVTHYGLV